MTGKEDIGDINFEIIEFLNDRKSNVLNFVSRFRSARTEILFDASEFEGPVCRGQFPKET